MFLKIAIEVRISVIYCNLSHIFKHRLKAYFNSLESESSSRRAFLRCVVYLCV